ncbi:MAG: hypothetical protein QW699_01650 [Metallosphaera sp.]|uniref:Uncharacterized protein n=1 Tax=Metallosphaera cuprina (strain Ar-4) TaxID=1006006 RepID=F4G0N9_METCR|nr:conserved hypothetical protein [Metallosphaera cuprina Ar-4]
MSKSYWVELDVTVIHYDPLEVSLFPGVTLIGVRYAKEERMSVDSLDELENLITPGKVLLIRAKNNVVINLGLNATFPFSEIVNVRRVGIPQEITTQGVKMEYKQVTDQYGFVGVKVNLSPSLPFVIVESDHETKVISLSSLQDAKPEIPSESKSPEKKKKKRAKKSRKRRKIKSKGSRKSRRV